MNDIERYRDDGPIARALGRLRLPLPPLLPVLAGGLALAAAIAISGEGASDGLIAAAIAWFVIWAGVSSGAPHRDRLRWAVPPALRLAEYSAVIWIAANAGAASLPAAFAFLSVLTFRLYDLVYRLRHQGVAPPDWLGFGGWDGRLVLALVLLLVGALPAGFFIAAAALAVVFVAESAASWVRFTRAAGQAGLYDDEEDEIQ
jgi:Family of unknown function (DUF5941)